MGQKRTYLKEWIMGGVSPGWGHQLPDHAAHGCVQPIPAKAVQCVLNMTCGVGKKAPAPQGACNAIKLPQSWTGFKIGLDGQWMRWLCHASQQMARLQGKMAGNLSWDDRQTQARWVEGNRPTDTYAGKHRH